MVKNAASKAGIIIAAVALSVALLNLTPTFSMIFEVLNANTTDEMPSVLRLTVSFLVAVSIITLISASVFYLFLKESKKSADLRIQLALLKTREGLALEQRDLNVYLCRVIEHMLFKRAGLEIGNPDADKDFYDSLVNNLKIVLDRVTGSECAVCIKSVAYFPNASANGGEDIGSAVHVKTFRRDRASYDDRAGANDSQWYPVKLNTGFNRIISPKYRNNYFLENDLWRLAADGSYNNGNEHWRDNYRSTAIVPIMNNETANDSKRNVRGFLCVDSLDAEIFYKDQIVNLLRAFSQIANQVPCVIDHQPPAGETK